MGGSERGGMRGERGYEAGDIERGCDIIQRAKGRGCKDIRVALTRI